MQASAGTLDTLLVGLLINVGYYRMNVVSLCLPSCHNKPPPCSISTFFHGCLSAEFNFQSRKRLTVFAACFHFHLVWSAPSISHFNFTYFFHICQYIFRFMVSIFDKSNFVRCIPWWLKKKIMGVCWSRLQSEPKSSPRGGHAKSLPLNRSFNWLSCRNFSQILIVFETRCIFGILVCWFHKPQWNGEFFNELSTEHECDMYGTSLEMKHVQNQFFIFEMGFIFSLLKKWDLIS